MGLLCCQTETIQDKVSIVNKVNLNQGTNVFPPQSDLPINHRGLPRTFKLLLEN